MSRPHTCFVQAQHIPWQHGLYGEARPGVDAKVLSLDDLDGSSTVIIRYPPGWSRAEPEYLTVHEEFLVLDGSIEINGRRYDRQHYGFFPSGYPRSAAHSPNGAVLLTMLYGPLARVGRVPSSPDFDPKLLVEHVNPYLLEWDPGLVDPQLAKGVAIKPLRTDPYTGETSFLYSSPPHRVPPNMAKPQWTHPMVEEIYVLDGEYTWADLGVMRRGGYCWWREDVYHGPSGTETGYDLFIRTVNGPLVNEFDTVKKPFTWFPEHRPILPENLRPFSAPWPREPNY